MLGEDHSLLNEFKSHTDTITQLIESDPIFAERAREYDCLDKEIRALELRNAPIADDDMRELKHQRAQLKDLLYHLIIKNNK